MTSVSILDLGGNFCSGFDLEDVAALESEEELQNEEKWPCFVSILPPCDYKIQMISSMMLLCKSLYRNCLEF